MHTTMIFFYGMMLYTATFRIPAQKFALPVRMPRIHQDDVKIH